MYRIWIFLLINLWIIYISRHSFTRPQTHGFYRFFAFETILIMALANADVWFLDPFSFRQILSWTFLAASAILALHGYFLLKSTGKPKERFEDTTILVQTGAYRFIRHPMYASLLLLGAGVFLKRPSLVEAALLLGLLVFVTMAGRVEEEENLERFGLSYAEYMRNTKMFIPFVF